MIGQFAKLLFLLLVGWGCQEVAGTQTPAIDTLQNTAPMDISPTWDGGAVTAFAQTPNYIYIINVRGELRIQNRQEGTHTVIETQLDFPQMATMGNTVVVCGRWNTQLKAYQEGKLIWEHSLPPSQVLGITANGPKGIVWAHNTETGGISSPLKDQINFGATIHMLPFTPTGVSEPFASPRLTATNTKVGGLALHTPYFVSFTQMEPRLLQGLSLTEGRLTDHEFPDNIQCVATAPDGSFYIATQSQLYRVDWNGGEMQPQALVYWGDDMPSIQKIAITEKGDVYLLTQEGLYSCPGGKSIGLYTETVAADLQVEGNTVYIAESGVGVYALGESRKWLAKFYE